MRALVRGLSVPKAQYLKCIYVSIMPKRNANTPNGACPFAPGEIDHQLPPQGCCIRQIEILRISGRREGLGICEILEDFGSAGGKDLGLAQNLRDLGQSRAGQILVRISPLVKSLTRLPLDPHVVSKIPE